MAWTAAEVICRAEGRADQRPLRFRLADAWLEVEAVEDQRLERGPGPADACHRVFSVTTSQGRFELRVLEPGWLWQCRRVSVASGSGW